MATVRIPSETHRLLLGLSALDGKSIGEWIKRATETQIAVLVEKGQLERMKADRAARLAEEDKLIEQADIQQFAPADDAGTDVPKKRGRVADRRDGTAVAGQVDQGQQVG
ncbi:MAG: hypothetical protein ACT4P1_15805 [Sporichthyaceae bacterium]